MNEILGVVQFFAGVAFIVFSKRLAIWTSSLAKRDAPAYKIKAISRTKWDSPYMVMIARIGMIVWGIILILSAYVTIFGTIYVVQ
jgi:hypothetical protein